jgi:hypothetical protein
LWLLSNLFYYIIYKTMRKLLLILGVVVLIAGCAKKPAPVLEEGMTGEVIATGEINTDALDNGDMVISGEVVVSGNDVIVSGEVVPN